ncbi:protein FANTASTIC FOUR 2-like [Cucumis melo var. makuwa]|uniref:Protein FANTASTIC FOUR 2-like n=2 Tax=Cucumis melo TaxID=3656 RepID=A0A5A7UQB6_CUCMM|nr:protein FANTASTIC FOUR 2-like [Cucumis melo var. makuwa]TYK13427.1 protein FANTASTIC FOUR 2-like [Cucumis melo var. makuwa]
MISSVCQGLQSHVESHVLSLQLFPQEPSYPTTNRVSQRKYEKEVEANSKNGENIERWRFLQPLSNGHQEEDKMYITHSFTKLSKKSLEMCTESLGSESGSNMGENDISLLTLISDEDFRANVRPNSTSSSHRKVIRKYTTYPPPLTSISGSTSVRVESYRKDGRLVLRAMVCSTSPTGYFQAERSHGRLKLQLVKQIEKRGDQEDGDDDQEVEEELNLVDDDVEEMGMESFGRPLSCSKSRCKQGRHQSKELLNWEPLWVST